VTAGWHDFEKVAFNSAGAHRCDYPSVPSLGFAYHKRQLAHSPRVFLTRNIVGRRAEAAPMAIEFMDNRFDRALPCARGCGLTGRPHANLSLDDQTPSASAWKIMTPWAVRHHR